MFPKPPRPTPSEKILDYDDGDPYSCMAAGAEEDRLQKELEREVETCLGAPEKLALLVRRDPAGVRTALYDLWDRKRGVSALRRQARWAAERLAELGLPDVLRFDRATHGG